ncbi:11686_t:CDS:2 [Ambispora leptoticha]|uniref:11686_t:CDS:1 n=1 Tax=Ambispora leptoticha TaxID=144679 RepID=A0A9N9GEJ3_9GLOM|nr:11686_t:CDS:2 [Ambispora leptoticha]
MATVEETKEMLRKAEKEYGEVKAALEKFEQDEEGEQWLTKLRRKMRTGRLDDEEKQEKARLEEQQKRLEENVRGWGKHVQELQKRLTATTAQSVASLTRKRKSNELSPFDEGPDKLCHISDERMAKLNNYIDDNHIVLLRSPPGSGKTTLIDLFGKHLEKKGYTVVCITMLDLLEKSGHQDPISFDTFWEERTGTKWTDCYNCSVIMYVLIDEAQILYGKVTFFWNRLKLLMQHNTSNCNLRLMLLSMYDDPTNIEGTPITFNATLGLEDLRLLSNEFTIVVDRFCKSFDSSIPITISETVKDAVFNSTRGHPGLVRRTLSLLQYEYRRGHVEESQLLRYLVSASYWSTIKNARPFTWLHDWQPDDETIRFLRKVFYEINIESTFSVDWRDPAQASISRKLKRSGLITETGDPSRWQFAAPLVRIIMGHKLFTMPPWQSYKYTPIRKSLANGAATTAMPTNATISPDVGQVFGSAGFLDFFVNGDLGWAVELMREGQRMTDHVGRFSDGGTYSCIPFTNWAIVDFRHNANMPKTLQPNVWYALYADNYQTITIRRQNKEDRTLTLKGDDLAFSWEV